MSNKQVPVSKLFLPLLIVIGYLLLTLVVFSLGPIEWKLENNLTVIAFLLVCWFLFCAQYFAGMVFTTVSGFRVNIEKIVFLGFVCNLIIVFPTIYIYTGKLPWQISFDISMQGKMYNEMQSHLSSRESGGTLKTLQQVVSLIVRPIVYAGVILGAKYFYRLTTTHKFYLIASIFLQCVLSISRGTDKEIFDVFVIAGISFLFFGETKITLKKVAMLMLVGALVLGLFVERRLSRYDYSVPSCFSYVEICIADSRKGYEGISDKNLFALSMISNYMSQGYAGLGHAMKLDYIPGYGVTHANSVRRLFERLSGVSIYERTYTYRLGEYGWDDRYVWSSIYSWFANDVGFYLTPFVFSIFGFILSLSWRDATTKGNDLAALVVCFVFLMILYSPANYQLAISLEMYFSWIMFFILWLVSRNYNRS